MITVLLELRVPAEPVSVPVVRTAVASLAARLDFTLDRLEDLRLAVDEACALVVADAAAGSSLLVSMSQDSDDLLVDVSRTGTPAARPAEDSFAWLVLSALVDEARTVVDGDGSLHLLLRSSNGMAA